MDAFLGKWVLVKGSYVNVEGMLKVMQVDKEHADKAQGSFSIEYSRDGDYVSAHVVLENFGEKTYKEKPNIEHEVDGLDGKKYKAMITIENNKLIERSTPTDGRPQIVTEKLLEGTNTMLVKVCSGGIEFGYKMSRQ